MREHVLYMTLFLMFFGQDLKKCAINYFNKSDGNFMTIGLVETFCSTLATAVIFYAVKEISNARVMALQELSKVEPELRMMLARDKKDIFKISSSDEQILQSMELDELFYVCSQLSKRSIMLQAEDHPQASLADKQFTYYVNHLLDKCMKLSVALEAQDDLLALLSQPLRSRHINQIKGMIADNYAIYHPIRQAANELVHALSNNIDVLNNNKTDSITDVIDLYDQFERKMDTYGNEKYNDEIKEVRHQVSDAMKLHLQALDSLFSENNLLNQPDLFKNYTEPLPNNLIAYLDLIRKSSIFSENISDYKHLNELSSALRATNIETPGSGYTMPSSVISRVEQMQQQMKSFQARSQDGIMPTKSSPDTTIPPPTQPRKD